MQHRLEIDKKLWNEYRDTEPKKSERSINNMLQRDIYIIVQKAKKRQVEQEQKCISNSQLLEQTP